MKKKVEFDFIFFFIFENRSETIDYKFSETMNVLLDSLASILETPAGVPIRSSFKESRRVPMVPDRTEIAY